MFIAALFIIAKTWKQPNDWLKEDVIHTQTHAHTHDGILLSHKKNEILPFATTWMDLEIIRLSEIRHTEKDKYYMIAFICRI